MPTSDNPADEVRRLRDTMRDLVALSTLPAVWAGYDPAGVIRSLAGVLRDTLTLDLAYVRVRGLGDVEVACGKGFVADAGQLRVISDALAPVLNSPSPSAVADPMGGGALRIAVTRFGHAGDLGVVVACSRRPDFPNESDRLLLGVGANQTAIVLQRKRAERERDEERKRLQVTLSSIGDAVIATDAEGRVAFMNGVAEALTGWAQADAQGRPLPEVFHIVNERTREPGANPAFRALSEGVVVGLANHTVLIARDGTERPIDDSAAPIRDGQNPPTGAVLVFRDVGERRRAEEAQARLAAIVESSADAIVSKSLDGVVRTWNAGAERLFGHTAGEAVGRPITLIIPPERQEEEPRILELLRRGERVEHFETVRVAKDGRRIDVSLTISPVLDAEGTVVGASKVARDITARRQAEQALREREERLRRMVNVDAVGVLVWGLPEGRLIGSNDYFLRMFGYSRAEVEAGALTWRDLTPPEYVAESEAQMAGFAETGRIGPYEKEYLRKDGSRAWMVFAGAALRADEVVEYCIDVSDRKRIEADAAQLNERLRLALDAADLGTWEWDPATDLMTVSDRASEMYGTAPGVPYGREVGRRLLHPDDRERARLAAEKAVAERSDYDVEYRLADRPVWISAHGRGLYDPAGHLVRVHGVVQDITERKRAEEDSVRLAERLRLALEAGGTGVWEWDIVAGRITWSDQVHAFYGMAPGEFDGTFETFARHLHTGDAARAGDAIRASVEDDLPYRIEYRIVPKGGGLRWISTAGRVIRDNAGEPLRMIGATSDVTERRLTEDAVRASEERFRTLFDSMDQGFCVIEVTFEDGRAADYRFVELNPAFERHSGLSRDLLGRSIREAVPGLEEFWFDTYGRVAATGEPTRFVRHAAPLGRWFEVNAFRLGDSDRPRVAVLFADVSDRKRAEEELRDQDRKKDDFIALLAHELRNPLAPIRNGLQVLRLGGMNSEPLVRARDMMDRQLTHMVRLIDDLLDVSRINRGKMELRRERVELSDVVASAVETARPALDAAGHELMVTLPATPVALDADLTRLAQVFSNLLTNSAKYTPKGGRVWLSAERTDGHVRVTVRDTGIGIPAASLPTIFDMFSQVDRSVEKATGGLGIGLALVKGLVEMHDGTVTAASEGEGLGTTFAVTLPVVSRVEPSAPAATAAPLRTPARRILVVDDNRDGAESMADMLSLLGHEVATGHDGLEAVARAEAFRPDVILMDVGMPRLNGLDATRRIREHGWGKGIAIIALTGWGQENDRERSREAGCDGHLVKPVDFADLQRALNEVSR